MSVAGASERLEWNGESLEREVMMSTSSAATQQRGRAQVRRSRGDLADLKEGQMGFFAGAAGRPSPAVRRITPMTLGDSVVSGAKSPVPRRGEAVEQGLLAMKLRGLKIDREGRDV